MKLLKLLSPLVIVLMLATLWGCSGDTSAANDTSSNQKKKLGKSLVDDLKITSDNLDQGQPSTAYDNISNQYLSVWTHTNLDGTTDIMGQRLIGSGTGSTTSLVSAGTIIIISSVNGNQSQPKVAFDPEFVNGSGVANGRYLVVWTDTRTGSYSQIYGQFINPLGALSGAAFAVSTNRTSGSNYILTDGTIGVTNGSAVVSGIGTRFLLDDVKSGDVVEILGERFTVLSVSSDTSLTLTTPYTRTTRTGVLYCIYKSISTNQSDADILYNSVTKKFVVAWNDVTNTDSTETVYSSISFGSYSTSFGKVNIASGPYIRGTACKNATNAIYGAVPLPVSDNNMVRSLEIDSAGTKSNLQNYSQIATKSGFIDDGSATITKKWSLQNGESKPKITISPITGEYFIAWSGRRVDALLTVKYTPDANKMCTYSFEFTGTSVDTDPKIIVRKNTGLGLLQDYVFGSKAFSPVMVTDPNTNRLLVAWEEQSVANKSIQGQMVDLVNFANYGSQIAISSGIGDRSSPVASFDNANQRYLVAWEDARNGSANISNMDIYGQFIDPQGNLSGGNTIISVASGNQIAPAVVFGGPLFRQFFVVWKDGRSGGNSDIFGQLLEWSALPQLVIADSTGIPINSGSLDFGNVALGQTKDITLKMKNDGNTQLTINQDPLKTIVPDKPYMLLTPMPVTITPGTSYDMVIRFAPTAIGSYAGTSSSKFKLQIDSNGGQSVTYFNGAGTGFDPLSITSTSLPDGTPNVAYTPTTLTAFGGIYPYQSWIATGLPAGLTLDGSTGIISGTPTTLGTYSVNIALTDKAGTIVTKPLTIKISAISITTTALNSTTNGLFYTQSISTTGGVPTGWTITPGSLPPGLTIDQAGVISGIPTSSGTFDFTVNVTDSVSGATSSKQLSIQVLQSSLSIATDSISAMKTNSPINIDLIGTGGTKPYKWTLSDGAFPTGTFVLDENGGNLSGTPTVTGRFSFEITLTDKIGSTSRVLYEVQVTDNNFGISTPTLKSWVKDAVGYSETLTAVGASGTYIWSLPSTATATAANTNLLPAGLTINPSTGVISGTPTVAGVYPIKVQVSADQETATKQLTITITDPGTTGNTGGTGGTTTGGGTVASSSSGGGSSSGCFIATAAYGSYLDPHVMVLRNFRDNVLLQSELGASFVTFYYKYSPPIADFIAQHDLLRMIFRLALTPLIFAVKYPFVAVLLIAFAGIWFIRRKFSVKVKSEMAQQAVSRM